MKILITLLVKSILIVTMSTAVKTVPDILDFFQDLEDDVSKVKWGHAINSEDLLDETINNSTVMMLEADVSKGHLINSSLDSKPIAIMAHPPNKTSDISLEMWIDKVIMANQEGKKLGAKLDFKDLDIVMNSLSILRKKSPMITFPLWLNADILKGPGGEATTPVDADIFLSQCTEFFPDATLSLGWTTAVKKGVPQRYTKEMFEEMVQTLKKNNADNKPITFPVRAAFVGRSLEEMEQLLIDVPDSSFTVWTSSTDDVDLKGLLSLQELAGPGDVYFDIPEEQLEEMNRLRFLETSKDSSSVKLFQEKTLLWTTIACVITSILGIYFLGK